MVVIHPYDKRPLPSFLSCFEYFPNLSSPILHGISITPTFFCQYIYIYVYIYMLHPIDQMMGSTLLKWSWYEQDEGKN